MVLSEWVIEKIELSWFLKVLEGKGMEEVLQVDSGHHILGAQ